MSITQPDSLACVVRVSAHLDRLVGSGSGRSSSGQLEPSIFLRLSFPGRVCVRLGSRSSDNPHMTDGETVGEIAPSPRPKAHIVDTLGQQFIFCYGNNS
jgi:hypothetical protein